MVLNNDLKMTRGKNKSVTVVFTYNTTYVNVQKAAKMIYTFLAANVCIGVFDELNLLFDKRTQEMIDDENDDNCNIKLKQLQKLMIDNDVDIEKISNITKKIKN